MFKSQSLGHSKPDVEEVLVWAAVSPGKMGSLVDESADSQKANEEANGDTRKVIVEYSAADWHKNLE